MSLFSRSRSTRTPHRRPRGPEGERLYVIGDIHGRLDLLVTIEREIARDLREAPVPVATTVFLGDYVDRGPDPCGVLEKLSNQDFAMPFVALCGNHEDMFRMFLASGENAAMWLQNGGLDTLRSYGISSPQIAGSDIADRLRAHVPDRHLDFLEALAPSMTFGDYFLCHAGVRPGIPLAQQRTEDLFWIREEFLEARGDHGKVVVHGHTPVAVPDVRANRINIDTGAFVTGRLTCLVIEGAERRFIST
jgi:serine/threonine protein phosphatase 1